MTAPEAIRKVVERQNLTRQEAQDVMEQVMSGQATPAQIAALLVGLRMKGETVEEITGFAQAMREKAFKVKVNRTPLVDTCGTGGGLNTFNISTTAGFVVAGAGVAVAKHGNRSFTSQCGSADVLEALGVKLELPPEGVGRCIDEVGIGFMFAPAFHPAMKHAVAPRREMGIRTVFNILGPLTNPAGAQRQVMGVFDGELTQPLAKVLSNLGAECAFVVHGLDGLDELSTIGQTKVSEVLEGELKTYVVSPEEFGFRRASPKDLQGSTPSENAEWLRQVLSGEDSGPRRDVVVLNAAAALAAAGMSESIADSIPIALESIQSGKAMQKLEELIRFTNAS